MKYNTMFNQVHRKTFAPATVSAIVRPDLSFSIQEIQKRFTIQQILIENEAVKNHYLLDSSSNDFDCPSAEVPQNYDLVDAYKHTNSLYSARRAVIDSIRNSKNADKDAPQSVSDTTLAEEITN